MWCRKCLREFQVNGGARASVVCPLCGHMLEETTRQSQAIRQAREILERWQASSLFDRIQETESVAPLKQQADATFPGLPGTRPPVRPAPAALPHRTVAQAPIALESSSAVAASSTAEASSTVDASLIEKAPAENPLHEKSRDEQAPVRSVVERSAVAISGPRSLVRELPPLPTDLLAPPPLLAAAARMDSQARRGNRPVANTPSSTAANALIPTSNAVPAVARPIPEPPAVAVFDEQLPPAETATPVAVDSLEEEHGAIAAAAGDDLAAYFETAGSELMDVGGSNSQARRIEVTAEPEAPPEILPAETRVVEVPAPFTATATATATVSDADADEPDMTGENPAETQQFVLPMAAANAVEARSVDTSAARSRPVQRRPPLSRKPLVSRPATQPTSGDSDMSQSQPAEPSSTPSGAGASTAAQSASAAGTRLRFDSSASIQQLAAADHSRVRTEFPTSVRTLDQIYAGTPRPMSFEQQNIRRTNVTSMIGQTLSYLGVLGLTVGTSMVILGHFGGYADYTPTGWLVTTVAQMLLFLGVINLVSGGIEQNNEDVSRRISALGEQLLRIEQSTSTLRGPHLPSAVWMEQEAAPGESTAASTAAPVQRRSSAV